MNKRPCLPASVGQSFNVRIQEHKARAHSELYYRFQIPSAISRFLELTRESMVTVTVVSPSELRLIFSKEE